MWVGEIAEPEPPGQPLQGRHRHLDEFVVGRADHQRVRVREERGEIVHRRGGAENFLGERGRRATLVRAGPLGREADRERLQRPAQFEQLRLSLDRSRGHQNAPIGMDLDEPLACQPLQRFPDGRTPESGQLHELFLRYQRARRKLLQHDQTLYLQERLVSLVGHDVGHLWVPIVTG